MAYWIKKHEHDDLILREEGEVLHYTLKIYSGPFRTLTDVEHHLRERCINGATILEFE